MIFKIMNDSVRLGIKPATDPNDFKLIDNVGTATGSGTWRIETTNFGDRMSWMRKPHIYKGNTVSGATFGTTWANSEWNYWNVTTWQKIGHPIGISWFHAELAVTEDIGRHTMIAPTRYKSTVASFVYKVSEGYSKNEQIRGLKTGTSASVFLSNIIKLDEGQTLTVKSAANGLELTGDALISLNDSLIVLSADTINTTKYILEVSQKGLRSDAVLTSATYKIEINQATGTISGFEYGTKLRAVVSKITVPQGATMDIVNSEGAYVPMKTLNFDTTYVDVNVTSGIYLDVRAEDGITRIVYQLLPSSSASDAFIFSDIYSVVQRDNLIQYIPRGTNAHTFLSYLVLSTGATMKLVDKMGIERTDGISLAQDDKVVVTSANGLVKRVYHLSMLETLFIPADVYLAYVLSNIYDVDQINYIIAGKYANTTPNDLYSRITTSKGATAVVVDNKGVVKTSGNLVNGDMLKVTSADGQKVVMYAITDVTSSDNITGGKILLYPNPTTDKVNINGLEPGTRIQVFNLTGVMIQDKKADQGLEIISLENQPSGLYLVVLTKDDKLLRQFKVIRK